MSNTTRTAQDRLRRLLVMLPWLMEREQVSLIEVAEHFRSTPREVTADLEMVAMCGLPPFSDELIDLYIDDDTVYMGVKRLFTKPLRLTAPEGFALLAAGRAALAMPSADPDGPLARGLAKLARVLGDDGVVVDLAPPPDAARLVDAARRVERVAIDYWTPDRDETSRRLITPRQVFHDRGHWYVAADDQRSGERRTFRIDRIESMVATGEFDDPDDSVDDGPPQWFADGTIARVTLRLGPEAMWVVESYPVDSVERLDDGRAEVRLPMASERFVTRLLIRLGPDAEVVDANVASVAAAAAARIVARYR